MQATRLRGGSWIKIVQWNMQQEGRRERHGTNPATPETLIGSRWSYNFQQPV